MKSRTQPPKYEQILIEGILFCECLCPPQTILRAPCFQVSPFVVFQKTLFRPLTQHPVVQKDMRSVYTTYGALQIQSRVGFIARIPVKHRMIVEAEPQLPYPKL